LPAEGEVSQIIVLQTLKFSLGLKRSSWLSVTISHKGKEIQSFVASCWFSLADKYRNVLRNKFAQDLLV